MNTANNQLLFWYVLSIKSIPYTSEPIPSFVCISSIQYLSGVLNKSIVGPIKPVYDGRDSLYTIEPIPSVGETDKLKLEVTLAAPDGRERAFAVDIKFEVCLQLFL